MEILIFYHIEDHKKKKNYPMLFIMERDILTLPLSKLALESIFSVRG